MQMKVTSEQAKQLLTDQLSVWKSARDNYKALEAVQVKDLTVEGCTVKIQFNPARIVSSAAKVDMLQEALLWGSELHTLLLPEYLVFGFYMYLCEKTIDI